jgi:antitoxin component YwqK of YwqJK toxin-antitoxin module
MQITLVPCPNGMGHFNRLVKLASYFNTTNINLVCTKEQERKFKNKLSINIKLRSVLNEINLKFNPYPKLLKFYNLNFLKYKFFYNSDIIISDNLINKDFYKKKFFMISNFFWSEVFYSNCENKKNYLKIISQIESVRKKNNTNWMDILRIAFENNPKKTAKVMSKIYKDDKCDVLYNRKQMYYKTYDMALQDIPFHILRKYNITSHDDFPCVFRNYYYSGEILREFYHNKGVLEGKYVEYELDGTFGVKCNFVNGKLHGNCDVCDEDNKIIRRYEFNNGNILYIDSYYDYNDLDKYLIPHKLQS